MTTPPDTPKPPAGDVFALHCAHGKPVYGRCLDCEKMLAPSPQESHKLAEELERRSSVLALGTIVRDNRATILAALRSSPSEQTPSVDDMVRRFLGWPLPETFRPDAGISFTPDYNQHTPWPAKHKPTGTNLFTADEARAMFEYAIAARGAKT